MLATIPNVGTYVPGVNEGMVGLGDIDISADDSTLYTVNLNDRQLYAVPIANPTAMQAYPIPDPGCVGGTYRPWATKVYGGKVYVGIVCDASTSLLQADLHEYVYALDPATGAWTKVIDRPYSQMETLWGPWRTTAAAWQPMIVDIEFDEQGNMLINDSSRYAFTATGGSHWALWRAHVAMSQPVGRYVTIVGGHSFITRLAGWPITSVQVSLSLVIAIPTM